MNKYKKNSNLSFYQKKKGKKNKSEAGIPTKMLFANNKVLSKSLCSR